MWKLKSCPKCGGDIFLENDMIGWYEHCLQCGFNRDLAFYAEARKQPFGAEKEPVVN